MAEPAPEASTGSPPAPPRWGLGDALGGFLVGLLVTSVVASACMAVDGAKELTPGCQALSLAGLWVGLVGAPLLAARVKGSGRLSLDFGLRARLGDAPLGLAVGVAGQTVLVPLVGWALQPVLGHPHVSQQVKRLAGQAHGAGLVLLAVMVVVAVPVVEELFFRGLLLRAIQHRLGNGWAVVLSAVAFGLAHLDATLSGAGQVLLVASLSALGVVLAAMAVRTGRLGPGIWAHAGFNAVTLVLLAAR